MGARIKTNQTLHMSLSQKREYLIRAARRYIGRPYRFGAKISHAPRIFDCSSFVKFLYRKVGIDLPRPSIRMAEEGKRVLGGMKKLLPGDLLYFHGIEGRYNSRFPQGIGHVALYIGEGRIIHASGKSREEGTVREDSLTKVLRTRSPLVVVKRIIN